jgi:peptidyl-Lys metalloendopeptidase
MTTRATTPSRSIIGRFALLSVVMVFLFALSMFGFFRWQANAASAGSGQGEPRRSNSVSRGSNEENTAAGQGQASAQVDLVFNKLSFADGEDVLVKVIISNPGTQEIRILRWLTPIDGIESDIFSLTVDGQTASYTGRLYKRQAPTESDYLTIKPGERLESSVDLADYYDMSLPGPYHIAYNASKSAETTSNLKSNENLVWISGTPRARARAQAMLDSLAAGGTTFTSCNASRQTDLNLARQNAYGYSFNGYNYLLAGTLDSQYTTWFGVFNANRYASVRSNFLSIRDAFNNATVNFNCTCNASYYAYVYANQPYEIFLCSAFWSAPATGTDSKAGTLVHEMSHFTVVAGTQDYVYGQSGAMSLAMSNPAQAIANADSHEYFAESFPTNPNSTPTPTPTFTPTPTPTFTPTPAPTTSPTLTPSPSPSTRSNYALAVNGGVAVGSTELNPASNAIDGNRVWIYGGAWKDSTPGMYPDTLQVTFNGTKSIDEISVFAVKDDYTNGVPPDMTTTTSLYSLAALDVQFWTGSQWMTVPNGLVTGNNRAWVKLTFSPISTTMIRVVVNNAAGDEYSRIVELEAWGNAGGAPTPTITPMPSITPTPIPTPTPTVTPSPTPVVRMNHALVGNGGVATGSTELNAAANANDGSRVWAIGGAWKDSSAGVFPDWLQVTFNGEKTIDEISVFAVKDDYQNTVDPTLGTTTTVYSLIAFDVQYWNGTSWVIVPGGTITGNNKAWTKITFSPISTQRIRVMVNNASQDGYSRIAELEAWGGGPALTPTPSPTAASTPIPSPTPAGRSNFARTMNGGVATGSTELNPASNAIDGSRVWAIGGAWKDSSSGVFPDWLQVDFSNVKMIDEISVYAVKDDYDSMDEPTPSTTTTTYSLIAFDVQYWNGAAWVTVPGGTIMGNNQALKKITFAPISTQKVRVLVNSASIDGYSRIVELEAWGPGS